MDIKSALKFIFEIENIRSKEDLDIWCGNMGRRKLYLYVKNLAPIHWEKIETPECSIRNCYQHLLNGYKISY